MQKLSGLSVVTNPSKLGSMAAGIGMSFMEYLLVSVSAIHGLRKGEMLTPSSASLFWLSFILVLANVDSAVGQTAPGDQTARDIVSVTPRLLLNTGGPTDVVTGLAFSPDSSRLFGGGKDKKVHVWGLSPTREGGAWQAGLHGTLHWEIARGLRGVIYTVAASPSDDRVAFAGYGAREATGDIALYDSKTARLVRMLQGHTRTVDGLDFSPDGKRLASISMDGHVMLWNTADGTSQELRSRQSYLRSPQRVLFLSNSRLAVPTPLNAQQTMWGITLYDLTGPRPTHTALPQPHRVDVRALAIETGTGRWASADGAGNVFLWINGRPQLLRTGRTAAGLAFDRSGRLAAACLRDANGQAVVELWNADTRERVDQASVTDVDDAYACRISADGTFLAVGAGGQTPVRIFSLRDPAGNAVARPLSARPAVELRGSGRPFGLVAFSKQAPYRIGFGPLAEDADGEVKITEAFDLQRPGLLAPADVDDGFLPPQDAAGSWSATIAADEASVALSFDDRPAGNIALDATFQGGAKCVCFLTDARGTPYAVAVGTNIQSGVFVYGLAGQGRFPLIRYFRDHRDWVTSLSVSHDGRYLASGSADQTVNLWSLEGLAETAARFSVQGAWGATFESRNGECVVTHVVPAGIAARRNLANDDRIASMRFVRQGQVVDLNDPAQMVAAFETIPLWDTVVLKRRRSGKAEADILLTPAWEPVLSLFVSTRADWAVWTPQGYYDASIDGDELFGWVVNRGRDQQPDVYRADQFRSQMERPAVIRSLLVAGNTDDAVKTAQERPKTAPNDLLGLLTSTVPIIEIETPSHGLGTRPAEVLDVRARIRYPAGREIGDFKATAYINGAPAKLLARADEGPNYELITWRGQASDGVSRVRVMVEEVMPDQLAARGLFAFSDVYVRTPYVTDLRRIHLLMLAVDAYDGEIQKLDAPVKDADALLEAMKFQSRGHFELGEVQVLTNGQATRTGLEGAKEALAAQITSPDDLLVVFLAGHGVDKQGEYYFIPPVSTIQDVDAVMKEGGSAVQWKSLEELAELPCKKLFLVDTCHAGRIVANQVDAAAASSSSYSPDAKGAVRALKRQEMMVVSATDVNQSAFESTRLSHGVFTHYLLDGLHGKADGYRTPAAREQNSDKTVDLFELAKYVEVMVPVETGNRQTPRSTPLELFQQIYIPLARY